ncbi:hypothetical protein CQW23_13182 [Capsicum baccatum]|uniref:F-box associated domain-containing protein n=1 Tax=Capsicum baccatum TaxID=33114 RepID=A0A2G2WUP8_CAPBA|nr:hypothetical protein CQW23_13182 [Capsicum baccatum]
MMQSLESSSALEAISGRNARSIRMDKKLVIAAVDVIASNIEVIDFKVPQSCNGLTMCVLTERSNTSTSRKGASSMGLYMIEGDSWRHCGSMDATGYGFDSGVFWNGAIHWIGVYFSVYFVVSSEEVGRIELPMAPRGPCNQKLRYFGESGGHLHLIRVKNLYAKKFIVLELDKDTLTWSMKYRVHLAKLISTFPEMAQQTPSGTQYAYSILSLIRGEMEEDSVLLLTIPGKVVTYNLVLKTVNVIRELPGEVHDTLRFDLYKRLKCQ